MNNSNADILTFMNKINLKENYILSIQFICVITDN